MTALAIGLVVDVPKLHPSSTCEASCREEWRGKRRGRIVELIDSSGDWDSPNDPLVCLEIDGEDGALFAWFRSSDIRARTISDPEFSLSVDAMVSEHRPRRVDDKHVEVFFPEDGSWYLVNRYRGPMADDA